MFGQTREWTRGCPEQLLEKLTKVLVMLDRHHRDHHRHHQRNDYRGSNNCGGSSI